MSKRHDPIKRRFSALFLLLIFSTAVTIKAFHHHVECEKGRVERVANPKMMADCPICQFLYVPFQAAEILHIEAPVPVQQHFLVRYLCFYDDIEHFSSISRAPPYNC